MKATFKLTKTQQRKAQTMEAAAASAAAEYNNPLNCGLYTRVKHHHVNPHQSVTVSGDTLVVAGHRCALLHDGGINAVLAVLGYYPADIELVTPATYETADKRLRWYETLDVYMKTRASASEKIRHHLNKNWCLDPKWVLDAVLLLDTPRLAAVKFEKDYLDALQRVIADQKRSGNMLFT